EKTSAAGSERTRPASTGSERTRPTSAARNAAGDAARDLERQRVAERMRKAAEDMPGAASDGKPEGKTGDKRTAGHSRARRAGRPAAPISLACATSTSAS